MERDEMKNHCLDGITRYLDINGLGGKLHIERGEKGGWDISGHVKSAEHLEELFESAVSVLNGEIPTNPVTCQWPLFRNEKNEQLPVT